MKQLSISDDPHRMVRKPEVAARWGVSTRTVEREVASGRLKKHKIRGCVCFVLADVLRLGGGIKESNHIMP